MPTAPNPDSQRPNQNDYLSFRAIAVFIPTLLGILIAIFGTAWTFMLAFKPQHQLKPITKTPPHSPILQSITSKPLTNIHKSNPQSFKQETVNTPFLDDKNTSLTLYQFLIQDKLTQGNTTPAESKTFSSLVSENILASSLMNAPTPDTSTSENAVSSRDSTYNSNSVNLHPSLSLPPRALCLCGSLKRQEQIYPNSTRNQPNSASKSKQLKLTLLDNIILALENNRPIKNAYLERIAQKQELAVAEDKFAPDFTPTVSISIAQFGTNPTTTDADLGIGATVSVKVPTGGELKFQWATSNQGFFHNGLNLNINDDPFAQNLQLTFNQPLLRGYGDNVNRASIDIARLTEQTNILDLKSTLINTITDAILAYRELIRAQERQKIAQLSLARAQELLANNRVLIEAGRLAPVDIVQSETEVARRQVSLIEAENNLEAAKLALLNILDIDKTAAIVASETLTIPTVTLHPEKLRQIAFANQPDYLKAQLDLEKTKLALVQAENNRLWDLNLNTSYSYTSNDTSDLRIGLALSRQLGNLRVERDFQRSSVNKLKAENTLVERRESLDIQLTDRIRDVNFSFSQVELAKKVTESSEKQLEIAREKQRLGRDVTIFELVRLQDDLVEARMIELNAVINYLNALTRLDQTLGTTLDTWQITIESDQ